MHGPQDINGNAGTQDNVDAGKEVSDQHYILLPLWSSIFSTFKSSDDKAIDDKPKDDIVNKEDQAYRDELDRLMGQEKEASDAADAFRKEFELGCMDQRGATKAGSTNNDELSDKELKQIEADDQAIQTILLGLPEDIYAAVDSCETAQEIWLCVQQMMKGSDIGIQEKKTKLFNEWKRFTSNEGESIESYYHRFLKLMNDTQI
nr:ribonuclease H-like domain-containing protein [Tanacetum cinerariifolium]